MDRKTFAKCMHNLSVKNKEVKKKMLEMSRQAAREAHVKVDASLKNQEIIDVSVSYDGCGFLSECFITETQARNFAVWLRLPQRKHPALKTKGLP
ncbi:hypothetical protein TNCV_2097671 [Trichonephila clavipes]|nr:hypothetical protein TNCV_2097671 [Trichonephila clavipes]